MSAFCSLNLRKCIVPVVLILDLFVIYNLCVLVQTRVFFGFHFQTVFLSLIYLDSFFSKRSVEVRIFKLLIII